MRPVLRGMIKLESLLDGSIDLDHIAWANDAINVQNENDRRVNDYYERQQQQRR